jgi:LmbE family N-acetylglucosaminyl deacetylase
VDDAGGLLCLLTESGFMYSLRLFDGKGEKFTVLCLGAHGDDIEIGCGGTILRLLLQCPNMNFHWVVFSRSTGSKRECEIRKSGGNLLQNVKKNIIVRDFRDGFLPFVGTKVKECFEQLKNEVSPDLIFTHYRNDLHQDHRLISSLTWNTFRDHLILEYEILKYDGGLGSPNFFVPLSRQICEQKIEHLLKFFGTQKIKPWFTADVFWSLLSIRGLECNSTSKYAEAFYNHKLVI